MVENRELPKNRIAELRKNKKISQAQLAKETGLTRQAISLYEIGKREPKLETWLKLADFFDVPVSYLQGISNNRITLQTVDRYIIDKKSKGQPIDYTTLFRGVTDDMKVRTFTRLFYAFHDEKTGDEVPAKHGVFHLENKLAQKITDPKKIIGFVDTFSGLLHSFLGGYGANEIEEKEFYEKIAELVKDHNTTSNRD